MISIFHFVLFAFFIINLIMRNFNSKTHQKPLIHHAFKKSDRKYPDPKKPQPRSKHQQNHMSIEKPTKKIQCIKSNNSLINDINPIILQTQSCRIPIHNDQIQETFFLFLQQPFPVFDRQSNQSQIDPFCLWFKNIQNMKDGVRSVSIGKIQYTISDWAQDAFPSVLYMTIDGIYGYLDQNGIPSNRVSVLKLDTVTAIQRNNVYVYDLVYKSISENQWQIPKDLTHFKLGICDQSLNPIQLPLPEPLAVQIKIKNKI